MRTRENVKNRANEPCGFKSPRLKVATPIKRQNTTKVEKPHGDPESVLEAKIRFEMWKEYNEKLQQFESEYASYSYQPVEDPPCASQTPQEDLIARITELKHQISQAKELHIKLTENDSNERERLLELKTSLEQAKSSQRENALKLQDLESEAKRLTLEESDLDLQLRALHEIKDLQFSLPSADSSDNIASHSSELHDESSSEKPPLKTRKLMKKKTPKKRAKAAKNPSSQIDSGSEISLDNSSSHFSISINSLPFEKIASEDLIELPELTEPEQDLSLPELPEELESAQVIPALPKELTEPEQDLAILELPEELESAQAISEQPEELNEPEQAEQPKVEDAHEAEALSSTELPKEVFRAPYRIEIPRRPKKHC